jgi:hypothetical protein
MNRRKFGLMAGTSMLVWGGATKNSLAQAASAASLQTTLTPVGAERAGNADGSIPAWTGGYTTVPAGWTPDKDMPDFFAEDPVLVTIDASNFAQYQDRLSVGVIELIQKSGLIMKVFQTRRTASFPQYVIENTALNVTRAAVSPQGGRIGFGGAYGGIPFPIPDADPLIAGAQIIWNHNCRWQGYRQAVPSEAFVVSGGETPVLTSGSTVQYQYPYYDPKGSPATFNGIFYQAHIKSFAPATFVGDEDILWEYIDPYTQANEAWELLQGQGRVRKTPQLAYDTPVIYSAGLAGSDEYYGFGGSLDRYDWKLLGKKEMYIPYNNNKMRFASMKEIAGPRFLNPDIIRWELHRVWVVDATLHPGERNVLAHRRFYVDEDTWCIGLTDGWDGNGNIYKEGMTFNVVRPDAPGTIRLWTVIYNLQQGDYTSVDGAYNDPGYIVPNFNPNFDGSVFEETALASEASY